MLGLRPFGLLGLAYRCATRLGRVNAPQTRQPLERRIALHRLERLERVVLVTGLQLRDAEREARVGLVLQATLAEGFRELIDRLVVLAIAQVGAACSEVLVAGRRGVGLFLELRQPRLVRRGAFLRAVEQPLAAVLAALVSEYVLGLGLLEHIRGITR